MKILTYTGLSYFWELAKQYISNSITNIKSTIDNYTINGKKISTNPTLSKSDVGLDSVDNVQQVPLSTKGQANGVASLDSNGHVVLSLLLLKTINSTSILGSGNITIDLTLYKLVDSLPTSNIDTTKIYLVRSTESGSNNTYTEYIYVNNAWEKLGEHKSDVDLTPYVKFTDIATTSKAGAMSTSMVTKLNGIEENANNYIHPTSSGYKHIPAGGSSGLILRWASDGTALWGNDNNTTYSVATLLDNGLMSSTDKKKLDGIEEGANKTVVDGALSATSVNPVQNKVINTALSGKSNIGHTHSILLINDLLNLLNNKSNTSHNHNSLYVSSVGLNGNNLRVIKNGANTDIVIPYATNSTSATKAGTADKATALATARTIWGQSFNGTGNVSGNMTGVENIYISGNVNLVGGDNYLGWNGDADYWTDGDFTHPWYGLHIAPNSVDSNSDHRWATLSAHFGIMLRTGNGYITMPWSGNVGIGTTTPTQKLDVNGTAKATTFMGNLAWSYITRKPTTLSGYGITDAPTKTGGGASGTWGINISGNSSTATALATARTINDIPFNGTANIKLANMYADSLSSKTLSLNTLNLSTGVPAVKWYQCLTDRDGSGITGRPNDSAKNAFSLRCEVVRYASAQDYITKQIYTQGKTKLTWIRYIVNGTASDWGKVYTSLDKPTLSELGAAASSHTHTKSQITDFPTTWAWAAISEKPTTLNGYGITDGVTAVNVTGTGNAVTTASVSGHTLTLTKGATFAASNHTHNYLPLAGGTLTGKLVINGGSGLDLDVYGPSNFDDAVNMENELHVKVALTCTGTVTGLAFFESSDLTLKENIESISSSDIDKVKNVDFKEFNFKGDSTKKYGVVALLVEEVGLDNLVLTNNGIKSVDYISLLVLKILLLEEEIKLLKNGGKNSDLGVC